ncbi:hypothetical protein CSB45_14530 [candidate division KSB3 bacterium]|uniref:Cyclophilin TM1367-like domain-containing protein n=1 Tax=candidate division KSB3 bacterium TaxID=2044937 RepID=A0A2G6E1Z4_9BACT|nr:MAG: hypothetical protein CSB45_14530 [candidate division KSB3 bacterium]PIE28417.1 MAG: hypothetical protein CSA57_13970 [candidate division KSB3 bacterium]
MKKITIAVGNHSLSAELNDSSSAQLIWDALPIEGAANVWGDEIYFTIPVDMKQAGDAKADVELGDLAYWPPGRAFCIFYGPTPVSADEQPRAAGPVNVFGRVLDDATRLRGVQDGTYVYISPAE